MEKYDELLIESKRALSKWEHEFQKTNSRKPSKEDFKSAPPEVTEAYKTYYKIKKKQELVKNNGCSPEAEEKQKEITNHQEKLPDKEAETPSEPCVWGEHLNKHNAPPEKAATKTPTTISSTNNYSKLTEKLMKGAKINIRTSLTRRLSSKSVCSPVAKSSDIIKNVNQNETSETPKHNETLNACNETPLSSQPSEERQSSHTGESKVSHSQSSFDSQDAHDVIMGFKPKIVQHHTVHKQPFSFSMARKRTANRKVDLEWLDGCLVEDDSMSTSKPAVSDDQDVIYSSDDEAPKPVKPRFQAPLPPEENPTKMPQSEEIVPPPTVRKRKCIDDDEEVIPESVIKKHKMDPPSQLQDSTNYVPSSDSLPKDEYDFDSDPPEVSHQSHKAPVSKENASTAAKRERLINKMASGTANQNFVRINLKKKVFSRGKKTQTGSSYKRQQWKQRQNGGAGGGAGGGGKGNYRSKATLTCRRCGEIGHWAKSCMSDKLLSMENLKEQGDEEEIEFPTLEEAIDQADTMIGKKKKTKEYVEPQAEDDLQLVEIPKVNLVEPFCSLGDPVPPIVMQMLKKFGHSSFRPGQEEAIMRILAGDSTLVVQSTGSGKSLCYQLPAVVYAQRSPAITIVISPLVSLMEDQIANLPSFIKGVCLHSGQSEGQRQKHLQALQSGSVHILLMSAESVTSTGPYGLTTLLRTSLPPVAFVCVDEAHCVSQWSHNFRPSYLRICKILREKMNINTILGLTATAPKSTLKSIADNLGVDSELGVIRGILLPKNLLLSVSRDKDRDAALIQLLEGNRLAKCDSIIIYCIRREECERLATLLRTYLKDPLKDLESKGGGRRRGISWSAESYHAGLTSARRISVQKQFMSGKIRIVVATVAFGMGINKSDIRAIIHYNAPKNFENYVQEIGRAGRDGLPAHCHVFLNSEGKDLQELKRFIYANSTDRHVLRKLMRKILPEPCQCRENGGNQCKGHEVAMVIESTVQELDMPEENIATLVCHLEAHPDRWILEVGSKVYATCTIRCYGGLQQLKLAARECPALGAALALQKSDTTAVRTFAVVDVARRIGWDSGAVKRQLKGLEWDLSAVALGGKARRSGIMVEFSDLAFHLIVRGDLSETEQDAALEYLHQRCTNRETNEIQQLQRIHQALLSVSHSTSSSCCDDVDLAKSDKLRSFIQDYFEEIGVPQAIEGPDQCPENQEQSIRSDIRSLILNYRDQTFTARSIARILHGISSPCFPAEVWGKARKHWRAQLHQDFNVLVKMAAQELLALK